MSPGTSYLTVGATLVAVLLPVRAAADAPAYTCDGRPATLVGTTGDDRLVGTPGDDRLFGGIDSAWSDRGGANRVGDRVRPGPGDDYVDLGSDRRPANGTHDSMYLHLTRALYDAGPKPGVADLRAGSVRVGRSTSGTFAGWEDLDLPSTVRWRVEGTDADERYYFEGILGVRVNARGGDEPSSGPSAPTPSTPVRARTR